MRVNWKFIKQVNSNFNESLSLCSLEQELHKSWESGANSEMKVGRSVVNFCQSKIVIFRTLFYSSFHNFVLKFFFFKTGIFLCNSITLHRCYGGWGRMGLEGESMGCLLGADKAGRGKHQP